MQRSIHKYLYFFFQIINSSRTNVRNENYLSLATNAYSTVWCSLKRSNCVRIKMATTLKLVKSGLLNVSRAELNLRACLKGGMSFRWILDADTSTSAEFTGVIGAHHLTLLLRTLFFSMRCSKTCYQSKVIKYID